MSVINETTTRGSGSGAASQTSNAKVLGQPFFLWLIYKQKHLGLNFNFNEVPQIKFM